VHFGAFTCKSGACDAISLQDDHKNTGATNYEYDKARQVIQLVSDPTQCRHRDAQPKTPGSDHICFQVLSESSEHARQIYISVPCWCSFIFLFVLAFVLSPHDLVLSLLTSTFQLTENAGEFAGTKTPVGANQILPAGKHRAALIESLTMMIWMIYGKQLWS